MLWFSMTGSPFCGSDSRCSRQLFNPRLKPGPVTPFCLVGLLGQFLERHSLRVRIRSHELHRKSVSWSCVLGLWFDVPMTGTRVTGTISPSPQLSTASPDV